MPNLIFTIKKVFRNNEVSDHHWPEFWMLEWYRSFADLDLIKHISEIMTQKQHQVIKAIKETLYQNTNSGTSLLGLSPTQSYLGLKIPKINKKSPDM